MSVRVGTLDTLSLSPESSWFESPPAQSTEFDSAAQSHSGQSGPISDIPPAGLAATPPLPPRTAKSALRPRHRPPPLEPVTSSRSDNSTLVDHPHKDIPSIQSNPREPKSSVDADLSAPKTPSSACSTRSSFIDMDDSPSPQQLSNGSHPGSSSTPRALSVSSAPFQTHSNTAESCDVAQQPSSFTRPLSVAPKVNANPPSRDSVRDSGIYETAALQARRVSIDIPDVPFLSTTYANHASLQGLSSSVTSSSRASSSVSTPQSSLLRTSVHSAEGTSDGSTGRISSDSNRNSRYSVHDDTIRSLPALLLHDYAKQTSPLRLRKQASISTNLSVTGGLGIADAAVGLQPAFDMQFTSTHRASCLDETTLSQRTSKNETESRRRRSDHHTSEPSWRASIRVDEESDETHSRPSTAHARPPMVHSTTAPLAFPTSRALEDSDREIAKNRASQSLSGSRSSSYRQGGHTESSTTTSHTSSLYFSDGAESEWLADEGDDYTRDLLEFGERTSPKVEESPSISTLELERWSNDNPATPATVAPERTPKTSNKLIIVDRSGQCLDDIIAPIGTTHLLLQRTTDTAALISYLTLSLPDLASRLVVLDISFCNLSELPVALTSCNRLQELDVSGNPLESASLPPFVSSLGSLRVLIADSCKIAFLAPSLVSLRKLHTLSIRDNVLRSLPSFLCRLPVLERLLVDGNTFHWQWVNLVQPILTVAVPPASPVILKALPVVEPPLKTLGARSKSYGELSGSPKASAMLSAALPVRRASANEDSKTRKRSKSVAAPSVPSLDTNLNRLMPGWPALPTTPDLSSFSDTADSPFRQVSFPATVLPPSLASLKIPSPSPSVGYSPLLSPSDSAFARSVSIANLASEPTSRKWTKMFRKSSTAKMERVRKVSDTAAIEISKPRSLLSAKSPASSGASTPVLPKPRPVAIQVDALPPLGSTVDQVAATNVLPTTKVDHASGLRSIMAYLRDVDDLSLESTPVPVVPLRTSISLTAISNKTSPSKNHTRRTTSPIATLRDHRRRSDRLEASPAKLRSDPGKSLRVIQEIIDTETSYVKALVELADLYLSPAAMPVGAQSTGSSGAARKEETIIPLAERRAVFANISEIIEFHQRSFLPQLKTAALEVDGDAASQVARVFTRHSSLLRSIYSIYVTSFDAALVRLLSWTDDGRRPGSSRSTSSRAKVSSGLSSPRTESHRDSIPSLLTPIQRKRVKTFMKRSRASPTHSQISLEAYLLLPVQRVPRYRMLLEALVSCTAITALDGTLQPSEVAQRALYAISDVATGMNDCKRESEGRQQLKIWERRLGSHFRSPLSQPHRTLVKEGTIVLLRIVKRTSTFVGPQNPEPPTALSQVYQLHTLHTESNRQTLVALLCSDILVILREATESGSPMELFTVIRLSSTPDKAPPASVFGPDSLLRVVADSRAILYLECTSRAVAASWAHAINAQQVLNSASMV